MGKHNKDRTTQRQQMELDYYTYGMADQQIRQAIVKEEQRQDVVFDVMIKNGVLVLENQSMLNNDMGGKGRGGVGRL